MLEYTYFVLRRIVTSILVFIGLVLFNTISVSVIVCYVENYTPTIASILFLFLAQTLSVAGAVVISYLALRAGISSLQESFTEQINYMTTLLSSRNPDQLQSLNRLCEIDVVGQPTIVYALNSLLRQVVRLLQDYQNSQDSYRRLLTTVEHLRRENTELRKQLESPQTDPSLVVRRIRLETSTVDPNADSATS